MTFKFLMAVCLSLMAISLLANDKIIPDLKNPGPEWRISEGCKIAEENGNKYINMGNPPQGNISSMSHKEITLNGVKQVKISLKYRTNVATSGLHTGAWYLVGFKDAEGKIQYDGLPLAPNSQWTAIEKTFDIPVTAVSLILQLRLQDTPQGSTLDASDICIELIK